MEVAGLIAAVVTLSRVTLKGVQLAKTLYNAPDELATLQVQLQDFGDLVQRIGEIHATSTSTLVQKTLQKAHESIETVHQLIQVKLLKHLNGASSRARRRAWARNKSKIQKFRHAILESRENLLAVISARNSALSEQAHDSLSTISQKVDISAKSTSIIQEKIAEMQNSLSAAALAIQSQNKLVNCLLPLFTHNGSSLELGLLKQNETSYIEEQPRWLLDTVLQDVQASNKGGFSQKNQHKDTQYHVKGYQSLLSTTRSTPPRYHRIPSPLGMLENSPKFALESYTLENFLPSYKFHTFNGFEEQSNEFFRVNSYCAFFIDSSRRWQRLFLSVVISRSSPYWDCLQMAPVKVKTGQIPQSLRKRIELYLSKIESSQVNTHLTVRLEEHTVLGYEICQRLPIGLRRLEQTDISQKILRKLDSLACPRFCENTLVRLVGGFSDNVTFADGRLLHEFRLSTLLPSPDELYTIQVLHCLLGSSRVSKFVGVVVDPRYQHLLGYLVDDLDGGFLDQHIINGAKNKDGTSWAQRERWGRQLVEGVCQVHAKGFVVGKADRGSLATSALRLNGDHEIVFNSFRNKLSRNETGNGYLPPEFRSGSVVGYLGTPGVREHDSQELFDVTCSSDIFHLGMWLWLLAESQPISRSAYFCKKAGCQSCTWDCAETHADPVSLPELGPDIPQYWKDIIAACREADPENRPPAWKILEMFPPERTLDLSSIGLQTKSTIMDAEDLQSYLRDFHINLVCNTCDQETTGHYFSCDTCDMGDFDICPSCFYNGNHCADKNHYLVERNGGTEGQIQTERFWSSPGQHGRVLKIL